ncbi:MAG: Re/Si-specific NAD(P)(+) transhydrogenase subunit alpha [Deltaproteobacteria bacterium]|nr:Re/Si-specific NAD(P)(+) transhydrogenase subunit alpha [Deltaproteobacteria bacterium]
MLIAVPKEKTPRERRVALTPDGVKALAKLDCEVAVEAGAGFEAGFYDSEYEAAGARIEANGASLLGSADLVLKVSPPTDTETGHEIDQLKQGATFVGFLRPLDEPDVASRLAKQGVTSFSMELIPRITRAQSMDALSSQATVMGYQAVLLAAESLGKFFPMLVTAAGTIPPARVLVVGAGVAGLQAVATAKRLGAVVEAYDTRSAVKEQIESVGGRFVELDLDTGDSEDSGGYAKAQTEEFYVKQRELLGEVAKKCDVVITTALVPGIPAPRLLEESAIKGMKHGSVVVDLAAANGGNVAVSQADELVVVRGVKVFGPTNLASAVPFNASQMYSRNIVTFLTHLVGEGKIELDLDDELTSGPLLTHEGRIANERVAGLVDGGNS